MVMCTTRQPPRLLLFQLLPDYCKGPSWPCPSSWGFAAAAAASCAMAIKFGRSPVRSAMDLFDCWCGANRPQHRSGRNAHTTAAAARGDCLLLLNTGPRRSVLYHIQNAQPHVPQPRPRALQESKGRVVLLQLALVQHQHLMCRYHEMGGIGRMSTPHSRTNQPPGLNTNTPPSQTTRTNHLKQTHPVIVRHGGQPVRDAEHRRVPQARAYQLLDARIRDRVHVGGRLVCVCVTLCTFVRVGTDGCEPHVPPQSSSPSAPFLSTQTYLIHDHHRCPLQQRTCEAQKLPLPHAQVCAAVSHFLLQRGHRRGQVHAP